MKNPKAKGNKYEIQICRKLSKWASGRDKPLWYWKSGSSRAQATLTKEVKSKLGGDVVAIDERGSFLTEILVIEVKDVKTTNILDFITPSKSKDNIKGWWEKVSKQAEEAGREPCLIFHRYKSKYSYVLFYSEFIDKLDMFIGVEAGIDIAGVRILEFDYFLDQIDPWMFVWEFLGTDKMNEVKSNFLGEVG